MPAGPAPPVEPFLPALPSAPGDPLRGGKAGEKINGHVQGSAWSHRADPAGAALLGGSFPPALGGRGREGQNEGTHDRCHVRSS